MSPDSRCTQIRAVHLRPTDLLAPYRLRWEICQASTYCGALHLSNSLHLDCRFVLFSVSGKHVAYCAFGMSMAVFFTSRSLHSCSLPLILCLFMNLEATPSTPWSRVCLHSAPLFPLSLCADQVSMISLAYPAFDLLQRHLKQQSHGAHSS